MKILKKNGRIEPFEIDKLKTSIAYSAYDIGFLLTESDLNMLSQDIEKVLYKLSGGSPLVSSNLVRDTIYSVLIDCGFSSIAKSYMDASN